MESPNGDSMLDVVRQELMKSPLPTNVEPCSLDDACVKEVLVSFPLVFCCFTLSATHWVLWRVGGQCPLSIFPLHALAIAFGLKSLACL